ncbi:MAG: iron ABC transporter permease [Methanophagales archaeon]|nr:iron ABC transporter permease [Methanophagales archaeon]MCW7073086.1 iron ABC transporter permease [Methanophagales archaeon]
MASISGTETVSGTGTGTEKIAEIKTQYKKFVGRKILFILFSLALIFIIAGVSAALGSYPISVTEVYSIIWHGIFQNVETTQGIVVWNLRLPRIIMGILAGMGLAIAGTMMQGILRNPLASPFTLGIASGAGFGAALAILSGASIIAGATGEYLIIGNAFLFSLIPTFVIILFTRYKRATPETMILAGIAMLYIFSAATTLLMYFSESEAVKEAYFWMVGSLGRATWDELIFSLNLGSLSIPLPGPVPIVLIGCIIPLMWKSWDLNVMAAGDEAAKSLGVNVEQNRILILIIASLMTAGIVCFTGTIGFIGLVAPHMCRMVIGGDNRFLIPASGLFGAALLLTADTIARRIIAPVILPVGVITAFMGGPLFLYLIMRRRREYW